jgi:hypothetical protein
LKNVLGINTCTGRPKSRRPQAILQTVALFYIHCEFTHTPTHILTRTLTHTLTHTPTCTLTCRQNNIKLILE